MQTANQTVSISKGSLWAGRIVSGLVILFMIFDGVVKVLKTTAAVEGTVRLGYPVSVIVPLGIISSVCISLYAIPRTSALGAILLTGYLGGATATQVRVESPWFLFPVGLGVLVWGGLYLRDGLLRTLIPIRS